ncbi:MAG: type IV toxin-antitoxin system AbiEi family antitoxin domain-containing protein [Actinomycetota bacterium]
MTRRSPQEDLLAVALERHGFVTAQDARALDIDPVRLRQMARRGVVVRVSRGVYRFAMVPATRFDDYAAASLWPVGVQGVLSHETALDLHELCDVNPAYIDVTVPRSHRVRSRTVPPRYRMHQRDLAPGEVTHFERMPIVTPVRAVLDGVETGLRTDLVRQAIDTLRRRRELAGRDEERIFAALYARRDATG